MVPRKIPPELAAAIDEYQATFNRMLGLLCALNMTDAELLRRITEALEAGEPIAEDDYSFYWDFPPGAVLGAPHAEHSEGE